MPASTRSSQILDAITAWNAWITPETRQQKYTKMAASPFGFYRGTNHLFWQDFVGDARLARFGGLSTWLQGDLHAENFGAFTNAEGEVVYSVNDFDEAIFADYQYDLWRMAISLGLITDRLAQDDQSKVIDAFAELYLEKLEDLQDKPKQEPREFTQKNTRGKLKKFLEEVEKDNSRGKLLAKWTVPGGGQFDLTNDKLDPVPAPRRDEIRAALSGYLLSRGAGKTFGPDHLHVKDFAIRLNAGTGSLGTSRYYLLIEGKTDQPQDDVILDLKRQTKPSAYPFLPASQHTIYDQAFPNDAQRAVFAYRAMTHNADKYLGWLTLPDGNYLVRERTFIKEAFPLVLLEDADDFRKIAGQWGEILATLHARADYLPGAKDGTDFARQVMEKVGKKRQAFGNLVGEVALQYALRVRQDWEVFREATH